LIAAFLFSIIFSNLEFFLLPAVADAAPLPYNTVAIASAHWLVIFCCLLLLIPAVAACVLIVPFLLCGWFVVGVAVTACHSASASLQGCTTSIDVHLPQNSQIHGKCAFLPCYYF